jgi:CheY-like chemotaxis protein
MADAVPDSARAQLPRHYAYLALTSATDSDDVREFAQAAMKRILIVDDDEIGARLVSRVLSTEKYECKEARSAADGLSMLESGAPDLIILDYLLPDMNGPAFYKQARAQGRDLKVLYCS